MQTIKLSGKFGTSQTQDDWRQAELQSFRDSEAKVNVRNAEVDRLYSAYVLAASDAEKVSEIISRFREESPSETRVDPILKAYKVLSEERCKRLHAWIESLQD